MSEDKTRLYVGNLSEDTESRDLHDFFKRFGQVMEARVIRNFETGISKGFGFIQMSSESEAAVALQDRSDLTIKGRKIRIGYARKKKIKEVDGNN